MRNTGQRLSPNFQNRCRLFCTRQQVSIRKSELFPKTIDDSTEKHYNGGKSMAKRKLRQWFKRGVWWKKIRLNRRHKDRLFRYLFRDKKYLLELYNALHDSNYEDPEELEVVTIA